MRNKYQYLMRILQSRSQRPMMVPASKHDHEFKTPLAYLKPRLKGWLVPEGRLAVYCDRKVTVWGSLELGDREVTSFGKTELAEKVAYETSLDSLGLLASDAICVEDSGAFCWRRCGVAFEFTTAMGFGVEILEFVDQRGPERGGRLSISL
jgi:hypothetical protein